MFSLFLFLIYLALIGIVFSAKNPKWWIKVDTQIPVCTYYFGPFESMQEAESSQVDYLQDLQEEGAEGISYVIQKCSPKHLTIAEDDFNF
ncbi:MAG: DUF1816 domain-containing protein [Snowella sp.]